MKKFKKGFTIVELVIVIAVIAILAGVLIPTFTSVATNARKSAALQEATSAVTAVTIYDIDAEEADKVGDTYVIVSGDYYFVVTGGKIDTTANENFVVGSYTKIADLSDNDQTDLLAIPDLPESVKIYKLTTPVTP